MKLARRRKWGWTTLLFGLLILVIYSPTILSGRNFAGRDLVVYHLPIEKAVHEAYSHRRLPIWIPEISGGRPLAPNPNVGALYPIRPLLAQFSFPAAMRIFPILHWAIAGVGMILLLRSVRASPGAAWLAGVTYAFSGPAVSEVFYPNIQPGMTLLPWVVWAVNRRSVSGGTKLLTLSFLFALLYLAGDVFTIGIAIFCGFLWIVVERLAAERVAELILLGLGLLLAGLLAAPQIVASALWVPDTNRAVLGMTLGESFGYSVSPLRLAELVVPFPFGPTWGLDASRIWGWPVFRAKTIGFFTTLYCGAFCLIALTGRKWRAPGSRFARILFSGALVLAVAPSFLPEVLGRYPSPLPLRYPEKVAVAIAFALAILAGLAFDRFHNSADRPRFVLPIAGVLTVLAVAAALASPEAGQFAVQLTPSSPGIEVPAKSPSDRASVAARELAPALAEGALFWALTALALDRLPGRGVKGVGFSLLLLTIVPIWANRKIARTARVEEISSPSAFARFLLREDPAQRYRTLGETYYLGLSKVGLEQARARPEEGLELWLAYRHSLMGRGTVFNLDFDVGDSARLQALRRLSTVAVGQPGGAFFGNLALRWGIRLRDQTPLPGYERLKENAVYGWDVRSDALPDIRLAESWREEIGSMDSWNAVLEAKSGEIVLETGRRQRGGARPGKILVLRKDAERLLIEYESPDPTWLFVLRGFWKYRTVRIDGHPAECVPAQLAFSSVRLPAGRHRIEWREDLPGISVSRWGPGLYVLLMIAFLLRDSRLRSLGRRELESPQMSG
jgi:hypothetical protein